MSPYPEAGSPAPPGVRPVPSGLGGWGLLVPVLLVLALAAPSRAQAPPSAPLDVALDCQSPECAPDVIQQAVPFVRWVRDPADADVHLLVRSEARTGGDVDLVLRFRGRGRRAGQDIELRRTVGRDATRDDVRWRLVSAVTLGLAALSVGTGVEDALAVAYRPEPAGAGAAPRPPDPWGGWVLRVGANGAADAEASVSSSSVIGHARASRASERWKAEASAQGSLFQSRFALSDTLVVRSRRESYGVTALVVRSVGPHVSVGVQASSGAASFLNLRYRAYAAPAVEVSLYPYAEAYTRQLTLRYAFGAGHYRYVEETVFGLERETLLDHRLALALDLVQPWGTAQVTAGGAALAHDPAQHRLEVAADLNWRLARGLSLSASAHASRVADQRTLRRGQATDEEILLRQRELATSFRVGSSLGLSYTFGSRYAGPLNPRFR